LDWEGYLSFPVQTSRQHSAGVFQAPSERMGATIKTLWRLSLEIYNHRNF
jgi:hypothetical protein